MKGVGLFRDIWSVLQTVGILNRHWVCFVVIWYIFPPFWYIVPKKSGNPAVRYNYENIEILIWKCVIESCEMTIQLKYFLKVFFYQIKAFPTLPALCQCSLEAAPK
jgi:hypothetical protein